MQVILLLIGFLFLIKGADIFVEGASSIAKKFNVPSMLIGLTIVAIGTSLPELVTSLTALKKDENQLIIGNVIGSNIFNILFVLGASSAISPIKINPNMIVDIALMLGVTILFFIFGKTQDKYDKKEGFILVALFIAYMAFAIMRN